MRALEFKSKVKNNQIQVPDEIQSDLNINKDIRVIVLIEDNDSDPYQHNEQVFQQTAREQFLNGYADSDSIYDNY